MQAFTTGTTKQRLIEAAGEVFAEKGYRFATVREIVGKAGANVAAINYHFRDKLGLYREVFAHATTVLDQRHPFAAGSMDDPHEALRQFVFTFMKRCLDRTDLSSWYSRLLAREILEPTIALDEIVPQHVGPTYKRLKEICRAIMGRHVDEAKVASSAMGVMGECLSYAHMRPLIERLEPGSGYGEDAINRIAEHVAELSLAGLASAATQAALNPTMFEVVGEAAAA